MVYSPWCFNSCLQHRDLIQKYWVEGFYEVKFTESVRAHQLMCEVAEVGEGEAVKDSLTVDVTEISPWPQASRGCINSSHSIGKSGVCLRFECSRLIFCPGSNPVVSLKDRAKNKKSKLRKVEQYFDHTCCVGDCQPHFNRENKISANEK